ncbi:MAG: hypothetical protein ACOZBZ_02255 [Patescibacteria group bacterium]
MGKEGQIIGEEFGAGFVARKANETAMRIIPVVYELQTAYLHRGGLKAVGILVGLLVWWEMQKRLGLPISPGLFKK